MKLQGTSIVGASRGAKEGGEMRAVNPATGEELEPSFCTASKAEIDLAVELATAAATPYGKTSGLERGTFLRAIADEIEGLGEVLTERAMAETALPEGRIKAETGRTIGQLRLFAEVAEEGSWVSARIDHGDPERAPLPKPDVRSMLRPVGPVVVFGASNFPLALSTAGGDTASALAAGNPGIVKAHPAHLGTAELMGGAVRRAVEKCDMPEGVFSLLIGLGNQLGERLVQHPGVKAVGFTGSLKGGRALMDLAAARPEPIPFFAEMGSINPVFVLPGAMAERAEAIATGLHGAVTLGVGQFCTNPGMVVVDAESDAAPLVGELQKLIGESPAAPMLTAGICGAYREGVAALAAKEGVKVLATGGDGESAHAGGPALLEVAGEVFLSDPELKHEVFGPSTLVVKPSGKEEALEIARSLEGQLTATLHGTEADLEAHWELIDVLEKKVGRLIFNGYPTGVEVCHAMVHGGPYPATSDGRSTSIGTLSIFRFARPVCYQDFPERVMPDELKEGNPLGIWRMVDGEILKS
jgi:alpha-ketoglutaric semialdehyde dehydrogenase